MNLEICGLSKQFGSVQVFDSVDLSVQKVSSLVLVGPSGGGKTTLLRILGGLEKPDSGRVLLNGREIDYHDNTLREYRKRVGFVFQNYNLFPHLTALENITLPLIKVHGFLESEALRMATELLDRFGLAEHGGKKPNQLSGGQKQRVAISRAISIKPEVLFLDEPTSALDPEYTAEVLDVIREVELEGIDTIMVTHEMGFARIAAEQVIFVGDGGILAQDTPEKVFSGHEDPRVSRFFERVLKY